MSNTISATVLKKALKKKLPVDSNIIENNYQERKIVEIHRKIMKISDKRIILLKQLEVVDWLFGGTMFWKGKSFKTKVEATRFLKNAEDEWGQRMLKLTRPDLKTSGQWTTKLGEHLAEEIFIVLGNIKGEVKKVPVKKGLQPDGEADTFMFETVLLYGDGGGKNSRSASEIQECPRLIWQRGENSMYWRGRTEMRRIWTISRDG
jgi:hypothetical protein